ncbi:hypothetical protein H696_01866 [Fonticula alba]|uniref:Uncharacterized protein n=1 Tax=Fonticula alba TaxID=691883 RepID=A0A058Z9D2_FONAL|nr:hypothetical protein H696_01866 [Fonticula alba]KCV70919.1 hypothetical protein H696_01866 [Fonticula alba]|eukprot:XP_009494042.1 hypothetical protein H696_01866 [Fonticula alba]
MNARHPLASLQPTDRPVRLHLFVDHIAASAWAVGGPPGGTSDASAYLDPVETQAVEFVVGDASGSLPLLVTNPESIAILGQLVGRWVNLCQVQVRVFRRRLQLVATDQTTIDAGPEGRGLPAPGPIDAETDDIPLADASPDVPFSVGPMLSAEWLSSTRW